MREPGAPPSPDWWALVGGVLMALGILGAAGGGMSLLYGGLTFVQLILRPADCEGAEIGLFFFCGAGVAATVVGLLMASAGYVLLRAPRG